MPDDIIEREVLGEASRACGVLVDRVRGRSPGRVGPRPASSANTRPPRSRLTPKRLLRALMAAATRREGGNVEDWVRRQFHDGLDSVGLPLREAVADSPHRHAVAQGLQQKMFEAELMLRRALKARFAEAPAGLGGLMPLPEAAAEADSFQRKAAG